MRRGGPQSSFVMGNFPRTAAQWRLLEGLGPVDHVLHLWMEEDGLRERQEARHVCAACGGARRSKRWSNVGSADKHCGRPAPTR